MTLHDLYDVLDDRDAVSVVQLNTGKKNYEVYCGFIMDFSVSLDARLRIPQCFTG